MAEELHLRIHAGLCKATVENTKLVAKHLKINEEELKVPIILNKIVIKKQLARVEEKIKVTKLFLRYWLTSHRHSKMLKIRVN